MAKNKKYNRTRKAEQKATSVINNMASKIKKEAGKDKDPLKLLKKLDKAVDFVITELASLNEKVEKHISSIREECHVCGGCICKMWDSMEDVSPGEKA